MKNTFSLAKFLTENNLTTDSKKLQEAKYSDSFDSPLAKKLGHGELYNAAVDYEGTYSGIVPFFTELIKKAEQESGKTLKPYEKSALINYAGNIIRRRAEMER